MKQVNTLFYRLFAFAAFLILPFLLNAQIIFQDDFSTPNFRPEWTPRPNLTGEGGLVSTNSAAYLIKYNLTGRDVTNALDLKLNLANEKNVRMTFRVNSTYKTLDDSSGIYLSNDGGKSFKQAFQFKRVYWSNDKWGEFAPFDLDKLTQSVGLNFTNQFVISFRARDRVVAGSASNYSYGMFLDDIKIYKDTSKYITTDFFEDFESYILKPAWSIEQIGVQSDWNNGNLAPYHSLKRIGSVGSTAMSFQNSISLGFSRPQGSALDLHLNLLKRKDVNLSFKIKQNVTKSISVYPDLQGLYFSDNGGRSFKQVFEFQRIYWNDDLWSRFPPFNIDKLARENGLVLSDSFIVRFQSLAVADSGDDQLFIDDVNITSNKLSYATLPFSDDFKGDSLKYAWRWSHKGNGQPSVANGNIIPNGSVGVDSLNGIKVVKMEVLKDLVISSYNITNALDLHLNLKNAQNVKLGFRLYDLGNDSLDFLFLSTDGGRSFSKIASVNFTNIENNKWLNYEYNLSDLAQKVNLMLTDSSIIRFQHSSNRSSNGLYIGDIQVKSLTSVAVQDIIELNKFQIIPNPNNGYFTVLGETTESKTLIYKVINLYGQVLFETTPQIFDGTFQQTFNLALPKGLYFLQILDNKGQSEIQKFIVP
jgi:hypothetical protein